MLSLKEPIKIYANSVLLELESEPISILFDILTATQKKLAQFVSVFFFFSHLFLHNFFSLLYFVFVTWLVQNTK